MDAPRADRHLLADGERVRALLGEGARGVEQPAAAVGAVAVRRRGHRAVHRHAHAQAFDRARELQFLHDARADVREPFRALGRVQLDFLGADDRDDLARRHGLGARPLEAQLRAAAAIAEQEVGGAEEGRDEARARPRVEIVGRADFEQAALVHDADAIRHRESLVLVMRDEDGRDAELLLDLADGAAQLLADLGVERAERLVEQEHFGPVRECAGDRDALLLAARELGRQALVHALERDELQELRAAGHALGAADAPDPQREFDVVRDAHVAEQRVVLEHEADAAVAGRDPGDVPAVQRDAAVVHLDEAGDGAQQGALAAAGGPEQDQELALLDLQRDVVDDRMRLIPLGDLVERDGHAAKPAGPQGRTRQRLLPPGFRVSRRPVTIGDERGLLGLLSQGPHRSLPGAFTLTT